MQYRDQIHGIDRHIVEGAMRKGRRERNEAIRNFFKSLFARTDARAEGEAARAAAQASACHV